MFLPPFLSKNGKKEGRTEQEKKSMRFLLALDIQELQNITSSNG
jgi:hypothetical protein